MPIEEVAHGAFFRRCAPPLFEVSHLPRDRCNRLLGGRNRPRAVISSKPEEYEHLCGKNFLFSYKHDETRLGSNTTTTALFTIKMSTIPQMNIFSRSFTQDAEQRRPPSTSLRFHRRFYRRFNLADDGISEREHDGTQQHGNNLAPLNYDGGTRLTLHVSTGRDAIPSKAPINSRELVKRRKSSCSTRW